MSTEFDPIHTERLTIRAPAQSDLDDLVARRNDPEVARLQDWKVPYTREMGETLLREAVEAGGPTDEEWWMATITLPDGSIVGDLVVHLTWDGRSAEVGYALAREYWGRGYATEALTAFVDYLFDTLAVTRVWAMLDPANVASARLLERTGFLFEGRTKQSYWKDGEVSDDLIYGMVRSDRDAWAGRPATEPETVELVEVTVDNFDRVARLGTHESQKAFVAPMLWSLAEALVPEVVDGAPVEPWMRAVEADGELVGFVMLALRTSHHPEPFLWRLLIDRMHQRRGIGRRVVELVVEACRQWGDPTLLVSWGEGAGSPRSFYEGLGFVPTGRIVDDETEGRLIIDDLA